MARYGQAFKDKAVARLLLPESASLESVARDLSISALTLERWRADALSRPARIDAGELLNATLVRAVRAGDGGRPLRSRLDVALCRVNERLTCQ